MELPVLTAMRGLTAPPIVRSVLGPVLRPAVAVVSASLSGGRQLADELLDRLIADVVRRVDPNPVVDRLDMDAVLDRLDLTATVLDRVDLEVVVREVLRRVAASSLDSVIREVDVDAVAQRLDIEAVLDRIDLTGTVLRRVDLKLVVDTVLDQIDLIALAEEVIDGVDLPEIIRESTGSMASETVRGVRMQGIGADQAVGRAVDRLLLRHGHPSDDVSS